MTSEQMILNLLDGPRTLAFEALPDEQSRHTGRALLRRSISFVVPPPQADAILRELNAARRPEGAITEEGLERKWLVTNNSYSTRSDSSNVSHTVEITEIENRLATKVKFLDMEFTPDKYTEHLSSTGPLMISFSTTVEEDLADSLEDAIDKYRNRKEDRYFAVERVGVSSDTVSMRFGKCLWQEFEGGYRHLLTLVSEEDDTRNFALHINEPEVSRLEDIALSNAEQIKKLILILESTGVLTPSLADDVREAAKSYSTRERRQFARTTNIDEFWLD